MTIVICSSLTMKRPISPAHPRPKTRLHTITRINTEDFSIRSARKKKKKKRMTRIMWRKPKVSPSRVTVTAESLASESRVTVSSTPGFLRSGNQRKPLKIILSCLVSGFPTWGFRVSRRRSHQKPGNDCDKLEVLLARLVEMDETRARDLYSSRAGAEHTSTDLPLKMWLLG